MQPSMSSGHRSTIALASRLPQGADPRRWTAGLRSFPAAARTRSNHSGPTSKVCADSSNVNVCIPIRNSVRLVPITSTFVLLARPARSNTRGVEAIFAPPRTSHPKYVKHGAEVQTLFTRHAGWKPERHRGFFRIRLGSPALRGASPAASSPPVRATKPLVSGYVRIAEAEVTPYAPRRARPHALGDWALIGPDRLRAPSRCSGTGEAEKHHRRATQTNHVFVTKLPHGLP